MGLPASRLNKTIDILKVNSIISPFFLLVLRSNIVTNNEIRSEFGKRLKFLRKFRKMSQWDLSRLSGIDRAYISEVENGRSAATIDLINRMARALDLYPAEFLVFSKEPPKCSYEGNELAVSATKLK